MEINICNIYAHMELFFYPDKFLLLVKIYKVFTNISPEIEHLLTGVLK
jgi:hypothetical protein